MFRQVVFAGSGLNETATVGRVGAGTAAVFNSDGAVF